MQEETEDSEEFDMFITRTISGAALLVLIIGAIIFGGTVWLGLLGLLSIIALYEMLKTLKLDKTAFAWVAYISCLLLYGILWSSHFELVLLVLIVYFIAIMTIYVIKWPSYEVTDIAKALFSFFYAAFILSFMYQIRMMDNGIYYMWLVFISAWGSDTCAYLVGILIGKHKVPSTLSPKKTIEGCVGGVVGAGIIGFIYGNILSDITLGIIFASICMIGSVISQIGDLAASAVKRNMDIKDYGKIIPGHGGIMDRFDSIIFVTPIIYAILYVMKSFDIVITLM